MLQMMVMENSISTPDTEVALPEASSWDSSVLNDGAI